MKQNNYNGRLQQSMNSGFNFRSSAQDVISGIRLDGKVAIVTGGNSGIGLETVRVLAAAGATVIVPSRDVAKAEVHLAGVSNVEITEMDLMDAKSIDAFAEKFLSTGRPLHILVNNAGIMWVPLRRDKQGIESQLSTNYLAQFRMTVNLFPALLKAGGARVVNISSRGHQFAPFNFEDPNFLHRPYETLQGYGQSKTACNLFSVELDVRGREFGVRAYSVHPGSIGGTALGREAPIELFQRMGFCDAEGNILPEVAASLKTVPQGAATTVWCATSPLLSDTGGVYCEDGDIATLADEIALSADKEGVCMYSLDEDNARRLWQWTEEITGLRLQM